MAEYDYEVAHANIAAKVMNDEKRADSRHMEKALERRVKNGAKKQTGENETGSNWELVEILFEHVFHDTNWTRPNFDCHSL